MIHRLGSTVAVATIAAAGMLSAVGSGSVTHAQSDTEPQPDLATETLAETTSINMTIDAPPSIEPLIDVRLFRDDLDATAELCAPPTDTEPRTITCTGLTQASYRIELDGVPDGAVVVGTCNGVPQQERPFNLIPFLLGAPYDCVGTISEPGVVMRSEPIARPEFATQATLTDSDGNDVVSDCELDTRLGDDSPREWCTGLADGAYRAVPSDVPEGYRPSLECRPLIDLSASGSQLPEDPTAAPVSAERPLWECTRGEAITPLNFTMMWTDDEVGDTAWVDGVTATVVDGEGVDVSASCAEWNRTMEVPIQVLFECPGLANGSYDISINGVPNGLQISNCTMVEVTDAEAGECDIYVFESADINTGGEGGDDDDVQEDEPTDDAPANTEVPTTLLPATGTASSSVALAGLGFGGLGIALMLIVRRRPRRRTI